MYCGVIVAVAGCGKSTGYLPVTGTVSLDGVPLEGASVAFIPKEGDGPAAYSTTNAAGEFELSTHKDTGAAPGKYTVLVTKLDSAAPKNAGKNAAGPRSLVPEIYGSREKSPVEVSLPQEGPIQLELKSAM
jgi:hypothetical protein